MGFLNKLKFKHWDATGTIVSIIEKWKPRKCKTEKDFEKSLYSYLEKELEDIQITRQYAKGRIRADIVVDDVVIIELKNNLDSTAKYQRLVGQLSLYKEWDGYIVVLLTGKTDSNLRRQLTKHVKEYDDLLDLSSKVVIIQK